MVFICLKVLGTYNFIINNLIFC